MEPKFEVKATFVDGAMVNLTSPQVRTANLSEVIGMFVKNEAVVHVEVVTYDTHLIRVSDFSRDMVLLAMFPITFPGGWIRSMCEKPFSWFGANLDLLLSL
jgi:hypothetical protein